MKSDTTPSDNDSGQEDFKVLPKVKQDSLAAMKKRIRRDTSVNLSDAIQALKEVSEIRKHESKTVMLTKEELEAKDKE